VVLLEDGDVFRVSVLKPPIRVMHETGFGLSAFDGSLQRPNGEPYRQCTIQRPAHHFARVSIEDHRQVDKFRLQPNLGDVRYPQLVHSCQFHAASQVQVDLEFVLAIRGHNKCSHPHGE